MKKHKIKILFFVLFLIILLGGYFLVSYLNGKSQEPQIGELQDYTPQEEISDEQYRETIVNLYFLNKNSNELMAEARAIDAKTLSENPYKKLLELLFEGPQNADLEPIIPAEATIYDASIDAGCVIINVSKEFLNFGEDETLKNNIINSIGKTLTELTEVETISFLIEGKENEALLDEYSSLK